MKWRKITDLTDEEVKELVFNILEVEKENTNNIKRDEDSQEVTAYITTTYAGGDEPDFDITDKITLYLYDIDVPFGNHKEYTLEYKKWLFAHGVCSLAYNNPFLKKDGAGAKQEREKDILPAPCTNVNETTVKDWFQKINEELDELKESILLDNQGMTVNCLLDTRAKYAIRSVAEYLPMLVAEEAADTITAITSMLEAMGIDERMRQEAQERVNRKNRERGRL